MTSANYNTSGWVTTASDLLVDPTSVIQLPGANPAATPRTVGYVWDAAGNRQSISDSTGPGYNYSTTSLNQYSSDGTNGGTISNGNYHELTNYQNISYKYINDTHLSSITDGQGHSYVLNYDALGRCVARVLNGSTTYYIYDGEKAILEYQGWSSPSAANLYGAKIDEILMRKDYTASPARTFYYQDDHEGSVTHLMMVVNNTTTVVESYRYDAFGKPTITNTSGVVTNNRFMFTGREYVSQFGIYEYRNRAYHPGLGRFMSEDPKSFVGNEYNLFRYCANDPLDLTDPMGLDNLSASAAKIPPDDSPYDHGPVGRRAARDQIARASDPYDGAAHNAIGQALTREARTALATYVKVFADLKVQETAEPITKTNKEGKQIPAYAKTKFSLDYPQSERDPNGVIHLTQRVGMDMTLPKNASQDLRNEEMKRPNAMVNEWIKVIVPGLILPVQMTPYRTTTDAERALDNATRPSFNAFRDKLDVRFDLKLN